MLKYGVIFSDSFNAICKCISKGYKTKRICIAHNTPGQGIEKFESINGICISRNYLEMRKYPTIILCRTSKTNSVLYSFLNTRVVVQPLNREKRNICVTIVNIKESFEMVLLENLLLLLFHAEWQEPLPVFSISYSHFS